MSHWSDMNKRAQGLKVRKEENLEMRPMDFDRLNGLLKKGIVHFKYKKIPKKFRTEGEEREAWGTKNLDIIGILPKKDGYRRGNNTSAAGYINYFDVEAGDWRCFDPDRLIGVEYHLYQLDDLDFEPVI